MPKVSVVFTSFNHEKYIREAIESVLNQTFPDFELIIWDDASVDNSWGIVQSYTDPRIQAFRNPKNKGPAFGINKAIIEIAQGKYIAIHHSDDVWELDKLERQVAFLDANPEIGAVFTWVQIINEHGVKSTEDWFDQENKTRWGWLNQLFHEQNHLSHPSVLIRKQCYQDVGLYRYGFAQTGDAEMWSRVLLKFPIHIIQEKLIKHRHFSDKSNTSGDRIDAAIRAGNEWNVLKGNFLSIANFEDIVATFPSLERFRNSEYFDSKFLLAMACLYECKQRSTWQLGLTWLFDLLNDKTRYEKIREHYSFSYLDFVRLTDKFDVYFVEGDKQIASLNKQIASLNKQIASLGKQINEILSSKSWVLTKPFRYLSRNLLSRPNVLMHKYLYDGTRRAWRNLPLSIQNKRKLKNFVFATLPFLFHHTQAYQSWRSFQLPSTCDRYGQSRAAQDPKWLGDTSDQYVPLISAPPLESMPAKLICFYLPQFHPTPENNAWWGDGFTEWTNVQPAQPQFVGHYQPHVPDELGYYNLLNPAVQRRQVELAKLYGIGGFCFYFYWFGGRHLLEAPLENYLNDGSLDLPFCLCWANENWTRRWDGLDSEILIAHQHSAEDDLAFIQHVARYMREPRYIRIDGKPLLLVYRPGLLPSAQETSIRWRNWCRDNDIGDIYLAYTQSFETVNPEKYGFDAAIEFPPNNSAPPIITDSVTPLGDDFGCTVYDWRVFVERSEHYMRTDYKLFRSVCPSWDNTARRKNRGTIFLNNTPAQYQHWLENAIADTVEQHPNPDERLIFVNAWNEWAEGAHLEPDAHYGYAWLQSTRNALSGEVYTPDNKRKIVLVAHDAYPHGAQMIAANLAKTLNQDMGFHVDLVCLGDGPLIAEYSKWATVHEFSGKDARGLEAKAVANRLYQFGHRIALVNTTVSGHFLATLVEQGIECVALIHELRGVLDQNKLHSHAKAIAAHACKIVFPAIEVAESFNDVAPTPPEKIVIRPQGLYKRRDKSLGREADRARLRHKLELAEDTKIVLGVGYADHRKGIDLFVAAGLAVSQRLPDVRWVWVGHWEQTMQCAVEKQLAKFSDLKDRFIFPGLQTDTDLFYGGADVFALTSREDPFPSVILEALDAGVPVVGFEGAGGFIGLLNEGCGRLVPKENSEAFALAVADLLENPTEKDALGQRGSVLINERFSQRHYVYDLLDLMGIGLARVSAIVPNYNYAQCLPERLESIIKQDYPIYEIIFLDDCSKDESIHVAEKVLRESGIDYRIVINEENSGSVFRQWWKGVELATGGYVWLAEADDCCSAGLISELLKGVRTPGVVLSYCESQQIDETGALLANNYQTYVLDVDARHWLAPFVTDGKHEIANFLSIKNTIPNVSAVLFGKDVLKSVLENKLEEICSYCIAGDWLVYMLVLASGRVAFSPMPLNKHRRHNKSLTISNFNKSQLKEIRRMQECIAECYDVPAAKLNQANRYIESLQEMYGIGVD